MCLLSERLSLEIDNMTVIHHSRPSGQQAPACFEEAR